MNKKDEKIRLISLIGYSKSGKTASIEKLISYLHTRNYIVLAFKHTPGKNTWKYSKAGADVVVSQSPNESAILFNQKLEPMLLINSIKEILQRIPSDKSSLDKEIIVILEGFRDLKGKKILCAKNNEEIKSQMDPTIIAISGSIFSNETELKIAQEENSLKFINILENPEEILKIYDIII